MPRPMRDLRFACATLLLATVETLQATTFNKDLSSKATLEAPPASGLQQDLPSAAPSRAAAAEALQAPGLKPELPPTSSETAAPATADKQNLPPTSSAAAAPAPATADQQDLASSAPSTAPATAGALPAASSNEKLSLIEERALPLELQLRERTAEKSSSDSNGNSNSNSNHNNKEEEATSAPSPPQDGAQAQPFQLSPTTAAKLRAGIEATLEAQIGQDLLSQAAGPQDQFPKVSTDVICVHSSDAESVLKSTTEALIKNGLPPWKPSREGQTKNYADVSLAYFIQVSQEAKLPLVRRVFDLLYSPADAFLYSVDVSKLAVGSVEKALGQMGARKVARPNVRVQASAHAFYYFWPRVQVVLDGMAELLDEEWDFLIHLSESDYPVHSSSYLRHALSQQRQRNFIQIMPRCLQLENGTMSYPYWVWNEIPGVALTCGSETPPHMNMSLVWPENELETAGFRIGSGSEWVILTRELVEYSSDPALLDFKRMISLRVESDELYWATLVLSIPNFTQTFSTQGWYINWEDKSQHQSMHSPATLTTENAEEIFQEPDDYLFIRKVDQNTSAELLAKIDDRMQRETLSEKAAQEVDFSKFQDPLTPEKTRCPGPMPPPALR